MTLYKLVILMSIGAAFGCSSAQKPSAPVAEHNKRVEYERFWEWTPYCKLDPITQINQCVWCKRYPLRNLSGQINSFEQVCR